MAVQTPNTIATQGTGVKQKMKILPIHIQAARALLQMEQATLAQAAGIGLRSLQRIEKGIEGAKQSTLDRVQAALEERGIVFSNGDKPGVTLDPSRIRPRATLH